ncbi:MAG: ATP-binding protein [Rhodoferax sp.]|nr:ATP-binding protein [Rhodoferax sp.]MDD2924324.1 ATP-binding protein [Rhodoferax sp.]
MLALLGVLVFLAREYEENHAVSQLELSAANMAGELRAGLLRNIQDLQALSVTSASEPQWQRAASVLLSAHREMLRLEWRDRDLRIQQELRSPFQPQTFDDMNREQVLPDVQHACANARRLKGPAYSASYWLPMAQWLGQEVMEMCVPVIQANREAGFIVATYGLPGLLTELIRSETRRARSVAINEGDGTRLAIVGSVVNERGVIQARQLLDLPGVAYVLRVEQARESGGWLPNILTATVVALTLALTTLFALLALDVRRRRRAEGSLAEALAFRKAMEDSLLTGLCARDMQGRITYVNPAFCQIVGRPPEQLVGTGIPAPYWPPEQIDCYRQRQSIRQTSRLLPRQGFESEFLRADGVHVPVLVVEAPLINAQARQTGWMSAIIDQSDQRKAEELSRASQDRLQATARLAMVGEMASLISHELNQPLAAIASYASGSLNVLQDPQVPLQTLRIELEATIQRMADQAERAGKVIKSVGDLVRRRERARAAVPIQALWDGISPLVKLQAHKLGIEVQWEIAADCPAVWCDATMVEQVLLNLVRNGFQAMPPGDPASGSGWRNLSLHAAPVPANATSPGRWVAFTVTDHGHGLTDEVAKRIFTPFFTTKAEGMGLGLSLCRSIVEQHGGLLDFEPATPRGTTFRFTLPAAL